ncbi:MAG: hypothetical protein K0R27_324 [Xanthobacteraceae bacterium]|jgi:hypothetical protein|nr:hypothetical protein [Xanthobacteraceae bacterium]
MSCGDDWPIIWRHLPWEEAMPLRPVPGGTLDLTGYTVEIGLKSLADPDVSLTLTTADGTIEIYEPIGNATQDAVIVTRCPQAAIEALPWGDYAQEIRTGVDGLMTVLDDPATRYIRD